MLIPCHDVAVKLTLYRVMGPMAATIWLESEKSPYQLPMAKDFAVVPGPSTTRLALTIEADDGLPVVVFVRIPSTMLPDVIAGLMEASESGSQYTSGQVG